MPTPAIGVTGSIGTGKTTFCEFLAEGGGLHMDADTIAKNLMRPGHAGYEPVIEEFGTYITDEEGHIEPELLAEEVFSDPDRLNTLEKILHPLVIERIRERISRTDKNYYVIDAPLLFEAGVDRLCDWVVVITAPEDVVAERLRARGMTSDQVELRRKRQLSQEKKIERADEVVHNNASLSELKQKAHDLRERVRSRDFR